MSTMTRPAPSPRRTTDLHRIPSPVLAARFAAMDVREAVRRGRRRLTGQRPADRRDDELQVPDSTIARDAYALLGETSPEFLVNHALRTYFFGLALARADKLVVDREVLFVAGALHDIGLTPTGEGPRSFELESAAHAARLCEQAGMVAQRVDIVHEAIALHAAVGLAGSHPAPEVRLVHFGAGLDVFGLRRADVTPAVIEAILARAPRCQFKHRFGELLADQATRKPQSHIAGHVGLGLRRRLERGPYAE
jgi:HD domain